MVEEWEKKWEKEREKHEEEVSVWEAEVRQVEKLKELDTVRNDGLAKI